MASIVIPFCLRDVCVKGAHIQGGMFSIKLMASIVSFRYGSCFCAMGCNSESTKLEMCLVGSRNDWSANC